MRARKYRPMLERLDIRLVLDSGASLVAGADVAATVQAASTDGGDDGSSVVPLPDWYLPGTPPPPTYDPSAVSIPWSQLTTG